MSDNDLPVRIQTMHLVLPKLSVYYPMVVGLRNLAVQQRINNTILQQVHTLIREQHYYDYPNTEVTGSYELKTNERGVLSLSIINYAITQGAAHGLTVVKSLTFDVQTGRSYQLKDLFKPNSNYVQVLSDIIQQQIKQRDIPLLEPFKGIRPDQDFYIADKSLVVYFQLYEIAPYVYGLQYFPISVYEIQKIITEDGPLGKMLY